MAELNLDVSQELNITTRRGDSISFTLQFKDKDGALVPITDIDEPGGPFFYNFVMEVRASVDQDSFTTSPPSGEVVLIGGSTTYLATRGVSSGDPRRVLITSGNDSKVTFFATSAVMRNVEPGKYFYDIEVQKTTALNVDPATAQTWIRGTFTVNDDVTVTG